MEEEAPVIDPEVKKLQDRLANQGRDLARERQDRNRMESELQAVKSQLGSLTNQLSEERQAEQDARIAQLPPAEQALAKMQVMEQELRYLRGLQQQPQPQREPTQAEKIAYQQQRGRQLIDWANQNYDLVGDDSITGDEEGLDWDDEAGFTYTLRALAKKRQQAAGAGQSNGGNTVATAKKPAAETDPEKLREQIKREVLQEMGVGGSNSPRPAGAVGGVSSEDIQKTLIAQGGPKNRAAMMTKLKEQREAAAAQVSRG